MPYKTAAQVLQDIDGLVATFPQTCTKLPLTATSGNRAVAALQVKGPTSGVRIPVVIIGGVHAREWAPPDGVLSIVYPAFFKAGVFYAAYTITAARVSGFLDRFNLIFLPLVNPDGRDHSLQVDKMWRKNRRIIPQHTPPSRGVDIARNFPIAWDHERYYTPAAAAQAHVSTDSAFETYRGEPGTREVEALNVMSLVADHRPEVFVDVHAAGRHVATPWGMETGQNNEPLKNFANPFHDHDPTTSTGGRDGLLGTAYEEYLPNQLFDPRGMLADQLRLTGEAMAAEILASAGSDVTARARSTYDVKSASLLYPNLTVTGTPADWAFSRQFRDPTWPTTLSFTIEAGKHTPPSPDTDDDGDWWPNPATQFPKVEREIHAALVGLLKAV
jgi:hypothetical protein